jgi:hypothetical protein
MVKVFRTRQHRFEVLWILLLRNRLAVHTETFSSVITDLAVELQIGRVKLRLSVWNQLIERVDDLAVFSIIKCARPL